MGNATAFLQVRDAERTLLAVDLELQTLVRTL
jgi:hypothetical protein